jgi:hypothetical protein
MFVLVVTIISATVTAVLMTQEQRGFRIHRYCVDATRELVLLFGIGTKALP